nr:unnamed protein product [Callosobruchus analis]
MLVLRTLLSATTSEATRIFVNALGHKSSSSIDYMATNLEKNNFSSIIFHPNIADHLAHLFTVTNTDVVPIITESVTMRSFTAENIDNLKDLVPLK